jgi:hypothetical protein
VCVCVLACMTLYIMRKSVSVCMCVCVSPGVHLRIYADDSALYLSQETNETPNL